MTRHARSAAWMAAWLLGSGAGLVQATAQGNAHSTRLDATENSANNTAKQGAFFTGRYRNLFVEDGHAAAAVQAKVKAGYAQLFHGDGQTQAIFFASGKNDDGPLAYVTDWANHDVRSEGMSYGMMLAVQTGHKDDFDALWNWAKTYMYVSDPKAPGYEFFAWSCKLDGTRNEQTSAPDGEEYFAMALYFASGRWGNGKGIYDYQAQANRLLGAMRHRVEIGGMTPQGYRKVSAEMDQAHKMIRFTPSGGGRDYTDPSYHRLRFTNSGRAGGRQRTAHSGRRQRRSHGSFS